MKEFNTEELSTITKAINLYQIGDIDGGEDADDYKVVRTTETTDDFKSKGSWSDIYRNEIDEQGVKADLILNYQYQKGEPRVNLLIINLDSARAVVEL